ncbi:unnamed protein product [Adineta ricciae]|uniref:DED domain-containing protein n=1 Tax=Adineta ricciae TaxID=249248 RepID=A0A815UDB2_ADIRI|nr:unnamed protein product [Adineta ricciae]
MDHQEFRGILLRLQDRLSDHDRKRLHFFFGNDVPRRIRDDPTLGGTLSLLESLFDQDKINEQDFTLLINALEQICCFDAAKVLKDHMKRTKCHNDQKPTFEKLSSLMPSGTMNELLDDLEDDRCAIKYAINSIVFISLFVNRKNVVDTLQYDVHRMNNLTIERGNETNETIQFLSEQVEMLEKERNNLPVRIGTRFCGEGGSYFDDSLIKNFTCAHRLRGMSSQRHFHGSNWFQFHYSSIDRPDPILPSNVHGSKKFDAENDISEQFYLDDDDVVLKVQVVCKKTEYYETDKTYSVSAIRGIRLFTGKGRISAPIESTDGDLYTEQFDGYYAAYVTGRAGLYLDQIQFYWTRASVNSP